MSTEKGGSKLKDPFAFSGPPRAFYHPSPYKDADGNVIIKGSERKKQLSKKLEVENGFRVGSSFQMSALPQVNNLNGVLEDLNCNRSDNARDSVTMDETVNSTVLNSTQLTSSIDENENFRQESNGKDSTSILKSYIDRFRYSAPKSREDREKERQSKKNTFWWLDSNADRSTEVTESRSKRQATSEPTTTCSKNGTKLTRDAVLELDRETLDLQQKADHLLSKSELSFASSGPCVSTDGLGSSSTLSDCYSFKSDPQPPYRPIFVNLQERGFDNIASRNVQERPGDNSLSPGDILARWRMRKKIEVSQQQNTKGLQHIKHQPKKMNEIDIRLQEFRKKLFTQRALFTSEDIQFERHKMKMLLDEDNDLIQDSKNLPHHENQVMIQSQNTQPQEDPILSRLRKITNTQVPSEISHIDKNNSQVPSMISHPSNQSMNSNSNNNYLIAQTPTGLVREHLSDFISPHNVNFNTKADNHSSLNNKTEHYSHDKVVFEKTDCVKHNQQSNYPSYDVPSQIHSSMNPGKIKSVDSNDTKHTAISNNKVSNDSDHYEINRSISSSNEDRITDSKESTHHCSVTHYHQKLIAEKPCDQSSEDGLHKSSSICKETESNCCNEVIKNRIESSQKMIDSNQLEISANNRNRDMIIESIHVKESNTKRDDVGYKTNVDDCIDHSSSFDNSNQKSTRSKDKTVQKDYQKISDIEDEDNLLDLKETNKAPKINNRPSGLKARQQKDSKPTARRSLTPTKVEQRAKLDQVIGESVVDHLFDGPSMISSVDSWASLFPQSPSPSHSYHNSTVATPTRDSSSNQLSISTPQPKTHIENESKAQDDSSDDSIDEYKDDPLMTLLLMQKKDYLEKLELIETKLLMLDKNI